MRVIEDEGERGVWLWEIGEYEESSVLAGQTRYTRVEQYETVEEAKKENPGVEVAEHPSCHANNVQQRESFERSPAPSWFDPADAGEEW